MKKIKLIIICLCISFFAVAQTQHQQVYVKTPGRLGSNGKVIPGKPLAGVHIRIRGRNTLITNEVGQVSFPIKDSTFIIQSVKKQGYVLIDPETTARQYIYSSNPLILVMETPNQQAENKLANEKKIRRTLQQQLQAKEDELERLKEENRIAREEYQKQLQQLYAEQERNDRLIKDVAERYTHIDYDQMDEFDRRINVCIMNGHLTEADSLLRSKGDISDRIAELYKERDIYDDARVWLEASEEVEAQLRMDLAKDCYSFHERFLIEQKYDSAAYYLELRAAIDTTNVRWNLDAGKFIMNYLFSKQNESLAYNYFKQALQVCLSKDEEDLDLANTYMCMGDINFKWSNYNEAYQSYDKAVHIFETFDINDIDACQCMERIALSYNSMKLHEKAIEQLLYTLSKYQSFHQERKDLIANCHINLGTAYENNKEYPQAFSHYESALHILDSITDRPIIEKAYCYNNMGSVCDKQEQYDDAIKYYSSSLDLITKLKDLKIRQLDIGYIYNNLASTYFNQSNYKKALDYYIKSLHFLCSRLDKNHPTIKTIQENIIVTINEMAQSDSWEDEF